MTDKLVPRLRFPEFRGAGEWEEKPLKKIASRRTERNRGGSLVRVLTNSAEYGVVDQRNYFDKDIATQGNLENYLIVDSGDFVYNPRISAFAPVGPISKNCVAKGVMSPLYTVFRFNSPDNDFYAHYFKSSAWHSYMRQVGSTGARHDRMAIANTDFMAMPLPTPSLKEQQKIADCLASLDDLIAAHTDKLDALKTHKKGLMQQLFPREGETVPRLRFPEFRGAGEWEVKSLASFAVIVRGGSPRPIDEYITDDSSGLNWLKIGDIDKESKFVTSTKEKVIPSALAKTRVVNPGDLILSNSMSFGRPYILEIQTCIHDGWIAVSEIDSSMYRDYLYYLIMTSASQAYFLNNAAGSGVQNLNADIIKLLPIPYPSKKEQQKIADCLTSLDDLITAQSEKIAALKQHKQGLMQQLFPSNPVDSP